MEEKNEHFWQEKIIENWKKQIDQERKESMNRNKVVIFFS